MLFEHERNYALGMDALVTVCSSNTNGIMVWAWMLWSPCALRTRTEFWFGHACSGHRRQHNAIIVWAWMLWSTYALGAQMEGDPGTCRRRSQTPSIPHNDPHNASLYSLLYNPFKEFGHVRVRLASIGNNPAATAVRIRRSASLITTKG